MIKVSVCVMKLFPSNFVAKDYEDQEASEPHYQEFSA